MLYSVFISPLLPRPHESAITPTCAPWHRRLGSLRPLPAVDSTDLETGVGYGSYEGPMRVRPIFGPFRCHGGAVLTATLVSLSAGYEMQHTRPQRGGVRESVSHRTRTIRS